jgi:SOS response associated peptidase (SRAP)
MCGRYRRTTREEELCRIYNIPIPPQRDLPISYNIAPSQDVWVIRFNPATSQRSLDALRWGLIPHWPEDKRIAYGNSGLFSRFLGVQGMGLRFGRSIDRSFQANKVCAMLVPDRTIARLAHRSGDLCVGYSDHDGRVLSALFLVE